MKKRNNNSNARREAHMEQDDVFSNNALLALMADDELDRKSTRLNSSH